MQDSDRFGAGASRPPATPGRPVRVVLIDDSPTMRRLIALTLSADRRVQVVGEAGDATEARARIRELDPDVLTLDVEMPGMTGLDFLEELMRMRPMPVVMVSSETQRGSAAAVAALSLGAIDCVGKPQKVEAGAFAGLADILVMAAGANLAGRRPPPAAPAPPRLTPAPAGGFRWNGRHLLIGASTGGVEALQHVLGVFPADCPPTVVVQHMPASFLVSFAARLDGQLAPSVRLAEEGLPLRPGQVVIAPGGEVHLELSGRAPPLCRLVAGEKRNGHRPSVDVTFDSARPIAADVVATLLTGMGRDGAAGLAALRAAGARTLAQDEASSVVWGMPRAAWELGGAEELVPLAEIGTRLLALATRVAHVPAAGVAPGEAPGPSGASAGAAAPLRTAAGPPTPPRPNPRAAPGTAPARSAVWGGPRGAGWPTGHPGAPGRGRP